jgi:FeS assembly SUF system protein
MTEELREKIVDALRTIRDPEIPINIHDLGLIYGIDGDEKGNVRIEMTLTAPNCPTAELIPIEVEMKVLAVPGVRTADVEIVWNPPWDKTMMSELARLELGI